MLQDLGSQEVWGFRLAGFQGAEDSNFSETRFSASDAGLKAKLPFCEAFGNHSIVLIRNPPKWWDSDSRGFGPGVSPSRLREGRCLPVAFWLDAPEASAA